MLHLLILTYAIYFDKDNDLDIVNDDVGGK